MKFVLMLFGALLGVLLNTLILMYMWNWIAVDLFSAKVITIGQALGLNLLCSALFNRSEFSAKAKDE